MSIPAGFCQCGCGRATSVATRTDERAGAIKGQPRRFVVGHNPNGKVKDRISVICQHCLKPFPVHRYRMTSVKFCGSECRHAAGKSVETCSRISAARREPIERLWERVEKTATCWIWTGPVNGWGYGHFCVNGKQTSAHRAAWLATHGEIPEGLHVLHRCDTPRCCRPDHLFLGTHQDNMADKRLKGRAPSGADHPSAILNADAVAEIRASTLSRRALSDKFGVKPSTIKAIRMGRIWKKAGAA